ncbi:MAG: DUF86 domain-containing protein [archaeon]|nr:DUF86 domain-containing protein [archaeon]
MQEYRLYINLIKETIARIEDSLQSISKQEFIADRDIQDATLMRLQVIGENIKKIPAEIKKNQ